MAIAEKEVLEMAQEIDKELEANISFEIKTDLLKSLISKVDRSAAKTTTVPIMQGIYLRVDENTLILRAMNNDFGTTVEIDSNDGEHYTVIDGKPSDVVFMDPKFPSMINALPGKKTLITIQGKKATIKSGRAKFDVIVADGAEYPKEKTVDEARIIEVPTDVLGRMYNLTVISASISEARPILTGLNHTIKDKVFKVVATDSYRLGQAVYEFDEEKEEVSLTIPATAVKELMKLLKDSSAPTVRIAFGETHVEFDLQDTRLNTRVLQGNYPVTERLIPTTASTKIQFNVGDLSALMKRVLIANSEKPALMKLKPALKQCRIQTTESEKNHYVEDISLVKAEGLDIQLAFNGKYLLDALNHYPSSAMIEISFIGMLKPFVIREVNGDDRNLDLILPVRLQKELSEEVVIENFSGDVNSDIYKDAAEEISEE